MEIDRSALSVWDRVETERALQLCLCLAVCSTCKAVQKGETPDPECLKHHVKHPIMSESGSAHQGYPDSRLSIDKTHIFLVSDGFPNVSNACSLTGVQETSHDRHI